MGGDGQPDLRARASHSALKLFHFPRPYRRGRPRPGRAFCQRRALLPVFFLLCRELLEFSAQHREVFAEIDQAFPVRISVGRSRSSVPQFPGQFASLFDEFLHFLAQDRKPLAQVYPPAALLGLRRSLSGIFRHRLPKLDPRRAERHPGRWENASSARKSPRAALLDRVTNSRSDCGGSGALANRVRTTFAATREDLQCLRCVQPFVLQHCS